MMPPLLQCYANKHIFTCDRHKKVKKNKKGKFTLLANKYCVVEISMTSEQHVGTYKHYNITLRALASAWGVGCRALTSALGLKS